MYFTDIVVRTGSAFETLADTFGGIVGYTLADSMSGGVALRNHLAPFRAARGARLYRGAVGGLIHARGVIEALVEGRIDVGPLDSYYHDLLRRNEPALAQKVRIVDSTEAMPIPPLVATTPLTPGELARIRSALQEATRTPELAAVTERLLLAGFVSPDPADYDVLAAISLRAIPPFEEL